eukprot:262021-Chlamydomonas_euryale.AAC.1
MNRWKDGRTRGWTTRLSTSPLLCIPTSPPHLIGHIGLSRLFPQPAHSHSTHINFPALILSCLSLPGPSLCLSLPGPCLCLSHPGPSLCLSLPGPSVCLSLPGPSLCLSLPGPSPAPAASYTRTSPTHPHSHTFRVSLGRCYHTPTPSAFPQDDASTPHTFRAPSGLCPDGVPKAA